MKKKYQNVKFVLFTKSQSISKLLDMNSKFDTKILGLWDQLYENIFRYKRNIFNVLTCMIWTWKSKRVKALMMNNNFDVCCKNISILKHFRNMKLSSIYKHNMFPSFPMHWEFSKMIFYFMSFDKYVSKLIFGLNEMYFIVALFNLFFNEVVSKCNMFTIWLLQWTIINTYDTLRITE